MNPAHIHMVINHIPIIGIGFVILLFIIALFRKSSELTDISLIFVILIAISTIFVHQSGESAEEFVEGKPGFSDELVQAHDVAADLAFVFVEAVGVIALITMIVRRYHRKMGKVLTLITLLGLIVGGGLIVRTANLGGKINHPEIRSDTGVLSAPSHKSGEETDHD
jgi:uncharacterized membrane protein